MKMTHYRKTMRFAIILAVFTAFFASCKKTNPEPEQTAVPVTGSHNAVLPYNFNWEDPNLNWMPYPAGQPKITVPWTGSGSLPGVVPDDVLADRKSADGWKLVYSTFDPNIWNKNPYFMLYNKYRGLLRIFMYINDMQFVESSYLQDGLYITNSSLKMLNFAEKEIIDASQTNTVSINRVQPAPPSGTPLANNRWYFLQYEVAYDPSVTPTTSATPPQFSFYVNSINVQQISLGGTIQAKINGTIGGSETSASQNIWSKATPGLKDLGKAGLSAIGVGAITRATINAETGENKVGVNNGIWKSVSSGIKSALSGATGNIPGAVVGVLSAIIGGSSSTAGQTANLTVNGTLKLDGSQTGKGALPSTPVAMYLPGSIQKNSQGGYNVQGYVPLYNESLGLFNIASKPTVQMQIKRLENSNYTYDYSTKYTIKPGTLSLQWNPVVNGRDATIVNLTTEIIAIFSDQAAIEQNKFQFLCRQETIGGQYTLTGIRDGGTGENKIQTYHGNLYSAPPDPGSIFIRVSFVVRPKDGSPDVAVIKTFAVNIEKTTQDVYDRIGF